MSLSLVSKEPCWALPAPGCEEDRVGEREHPDLHYRDRETARKAAVDRLEWGAGNPVGPEREPCLCWTADCDNCDWSYDEDEIGAKTHIPGDLKGPLDEVFTEGDGSIYGALFWLADGRLVCSECRDELRTPEAWPEPIPGQGNLLEAL